MKPPMSVAEFIKRARDAGHDALGLGHDAEALMALAAVRRQTFLEKRDEPSLRSWRELVREVANMETPDPITTRWLAIEHVRLGRAFALAAAADPTLQADATTWIATLGAEERQDEIQRFELDWVAPFKVAAVAWRG
jgi:hypothetical protein